MVIQLCDGLSVFFSTIENSEICNNHAYRRHRREREMLCACVRGFAVTFVIT